jgi:hypothetical protein
MPVRGGRLPEVRGEDAYPLLQQPPQLPLVPTYGLRVAQIYDRVVHRRLAVGAQDRVAFLDRFLVQFISRVEVRQLPEAHAEAVFFEVGVHLLWVFEAGRGELEVAAVGHLGPAGV